MFYTNARLQALSYSVQGVGIPAFHSSKIPFLSAIVYFILLMCWIVDNKRGRWQDMHWCKIMFICSNRRCILPTYLYRYFLLLRYLIYLCLVNLPLNSFVGPSIHILFHIYIYNILVCSLGYWITCFLLGFSAF